MEGYDLHLYCDGKHKPWAAPQAEFGGRDQRDAYRQAKKRGWTIKRAPAPEGSVAGGRLAFCPSCTEKRRRGERA